MLPVKTNDRNDLDLTVHQHDPHAVDGRRAGSQLGASGHADGHGAGGLLPVAAVPAIRPAGSDLAQPRPLHSLGGPRLDAAVLAAAPHGSEGGQQGLRDPGRAVGAAGGDQALSATGQPMPRPPGVPLDQRRRDHHRSAWATAWPPASAWPSPAGGWPLISTSPDSRT